MSIRHGCIAPAGSGRGDAPVTPEYAARPTKRRGLTPLRATLAGIGIAVVAFCGGFGAATAISAVSAPAQPPDVQLEMPSGLPHGY